MGFYCTGFRSAAATAFDTRPAGAEPTIAAAALDKLCETGCSAIQVMSLLLLSECSCC